MSAAAEQFAHHVGQPEQRLISIVPALELELPAEPEEVPETSGRSLPEPAALEQFVAGAVEGDTRARDELLTEIRPLVLRYCRGRLGRQETVIGSAEDVAQDVCLAVVNALPTYTVKGLSFRAFVYGIAAHKVTDAFRAIGRNRSEPVAEVPDMAVSHDGPEHRVLAVELNHRLGGLLDTLTERQREVLVLRLAVGLSAEETAKTVGSTPGAVRVTQHRALGRLRQLVAETGVAVPGLAATPAPADDEDRDGR
jgi:RNA polymerase sigma-70 factor (ECF subfamily)